MVDVHLAARAFRRAVIQPTKPLRSSISRSTTAPGSPVSRSVLLSIRSERLKLDVTGCTVSPMRASDAFVGLCLTARIYSDFRRTQPIIPTSVNKPVSGSTRKINGF
jgi:hypothetical protein